VGQDAILRAGPGRIRTPDCQPAPGVPRPSPPLQVGNPSDSKLNLQFVFTTLYTAKKALRMASSYAIGLEARISIVAAQIVPYPLPLENPPVRTQVLERTLGTLAAEQPVETDVQIYLCRDAAETIRRVLHHESAVVIGRPRRWWPSLERRLATALRQDGHRVICV